MRLLRRVPRQSARPAEPFLFAGVKQSRALGHDYVGTEHVLLALVEDRETRAALALARLGVTRDVVRRDIERIIGTCTEQPRRAIDADALATLGIDLDEVTRRVEETFGPGALQPRDSTCRCIAPRLKKALELAVTEAGDGPVRAEHVLISIAAIDDCIAARILQAHGIGLATLREALSSGA
jgi:ATP-dependent Clp protease ATP-binding subunit ClpA